VRLAARGRREDDEGKGSDVDDKLFDEAIRKQARSVTIKSLVTTAIVVAIVMLIPPLR
jgi:hypothetical protein